MYTVSYLDTDNKRKHVSRTVPLPLELYVPSYYRGGVDEISDGAQANLQSIHNDCVRRKNQYHKNREKEIRNSHEWNQKKRKEICRVRCQVT